MTDQAWRLEDRSHTPQRALQQNHTGITPPPGYKAPRAPFDAFLIWGIVAAVIFVIAGFIAIFSLAEARYTNDLAIGITAAVFSAGGFVGIILSRIGTEIRRTGATR